MNNTATIVRSNITPNHESVKYWADLNEDPQGGLIKYFNGTKWVLVNGDSSKSDKLEKVITEQETNIKNLESRVKTMAADLEEITKYAMSLQTQLNNFTDDYNS